MVLSFKTAGESHGKGLMVIIDGMPAGVKVDIDLINKKLGRRQGGYGRGGRMKIEKDKVEVLSGIRCGETIGSPVGLLIYNRDWENWKKVMSPVTRPGVGNEEISIKKDGKIKKIKRVVTRPRPGHADLAGALKYNQSDIRNILERASARETAARTAAGAVAQALLKYFDIDIISHVIQIGEVKSSSPEVDFDTLKERILKSPLNCYDKKKEQEMINHIDKIKEAGDSLGGVIEIRTTPLPVGLGSHVQWDRRLDGRLAQALISIPAIKGVEIGTAFDNAGSYGSRVHDEIFYSKEKGFYRKTNRAGGLEGGITNGEPLIIRLAMKPIPTLYSPLQSVDIVTKKPFTASVERSDVTAVPAAGVVAEAMVSFILAQAILEKFGGDHIDEIFDNYKRFLDKM
ncbi:Chorismate synthase [Halothermothrix orenii H 168]|uniref:Chorismate synthase n=1 Tax=Halothermothrix orenii (strain H 168 / OCM 544 / DSM 9562) TaxID=373903 RepID=B8D2E0_HALOH|nr:Chorismate synthase [Halothermothrix orenii H 168]